jgi:hypothetical protein
MEIKMVEERTCELSFTREELRTVHQALNEVCHGVNFTDSEFSTRMGTDRKAAIILMVQIGSAYGLLDKE